MTTPPPAGAQLDLQLRGYLRAYQGVPSWLYQCDELIAGLVKITEAHATRRAGETRKALESARAALADNANSQRLGGKGITLAYYHAVDKELRAALQEPT